MFAHQKKALLLFALLFFTVSVACSTSSLPFISGEPEAEIAPTVNPADLEIMIAEAAATKVAQTLEAIPTKPGLHAVNGLLAQALKLSVDPYPSLTRMPML